MNKRGLMILVGSLAVAALLTVIWFVGLLTNIAGNLIHLLLVLALVIGSIGGIVGLIVMLVGNKR